MIKLTAVSGDTMYDIHEYVVDTVDDLPKIPQCAMGSTALVISTATLYVRNSAGEWVKL